MTDKDGKPTPFFMRWWQEQVASNAAIANLSTPEAVSAVLDVLGAEARGQILYRGATIWELLEPDTAGKLLVTNGAAADPSWSTLSSTIDTAIGGTHGDILFRGAAGWERLGFGTVGDVLSTNGAGADPAWITAAGGGGASIAIKARYWRILRNVSSDPNFVGMAELGWNGTTTGGTVGGTPDASSSFSTSFNEDKAFDGNITTGWATQAAQIVNAWISWDFGSSTVVSEFYIHPGTSPAYVPTDFDLECSLDGTNWLFVQNYTATWSSGVGQAFTVDYEFGGRLTDLIDTPDAFGTTGQILQVNAAGTALEFATAGGGGASAFTDLTDTPGALGSAGQFIKVNAGGTALEFTPAPSGASGVTTSEVLLNQSFSTTSVTTTPQVLGVDLTQYDEIHIHSEIFSGGSQLRYQFSPDAGSTWRTNLYSRLYTGISSDNYDNSNQTHFTAVDGGGNNAGFATIKHHNNPATRTYKEGMWSSGASGTTVFKVDGWQDRLEIANDIRFFASGTTITSGILVVIGVKYGGALFNNLAATVAPAVTNDGTEDYVIGSRWIDVTNDNTYTCVDNTTGAAVWVQENGAGGGGAAAFTDLTDTPGTLGTAGQIAKMNAGATALEFTNNIVDFGSDGITVDTSTSSSTSAYASKGAIITPNTDILLNAIEFFISGTAPAQTVDVTVCQLDNANPGTINTIIHPLGTMSSVNPINQEWFTFPTPLSLTAGVTYAIIFVRTDGTATTAMRVSFPGVLGQNDPAGLWSIELGGVRYASLEPAVSDNVYAAVTGPVQMRIHAQIDQGFVPVGGTVGQVLSKVDGVDFNSEWVDPSGGAAAFTDLTDTPVGLGTAGQFIKVNAGATALEFTDVTPEGGWELIETKNFGSSPSVSHDFAFDPTLYDEIKLICRDFDVTASASFRAATRFLKSGATVLVSDAGYYYGRWSDSFDDVQKTATAFTASLGCSDPVNFTWNFTGLGSGAPIEFDYFSSDNVLADIFAANGYYFGADITADVIDGIRLFDSGTSGSINSGTGWLLGRRKGSAGGGGGASTFTDLTDTPGALGTALQILQVNAGATALEFIPAPPAAAAVPVQDDGVEIVASPSDLNFTGAGVIVTDVAGVATIAIAGGAPAGLGAADNNDETDATYFYFGWDDDGTGDWLIRRQTRATGIYMSATEAANPSYATLLLSWPDRVSLTYA